MKTKISIPVDSLKAKSVEPLVSIPATAEATGLTESYIKKAIREDGFPSYKIGGRRMCRLSEAEAWIQQRAQRTA